MGGIFGFVSDLLFGKPPDPNPGIIANAEVTREIGMRQMDIAQESLDFTKQQYADTLPIFQQLAEQAIRVGDANETRAAQYQQHWEQNFMPLEGQLAKEAADFDTAGNRERLAQTAAADIGKAYQGIQGQLTRQLGKYGVTPSPGEFVALNASLLRDKALQTAGAMTDTRVQAQQQGTAMKYNAAQLGRNLPGNASQAYGTTLAAGQSAGSLTQAPGAAYQAGLQGASGAYGSATGSFGTSSNIYGLDNKIRYNNWSTRANLGMAGAESLASIGGTIMGAMMGAKDGGEVDGPGGSKDDRIPAMLSDGEYVVPAAVVKRLGVKHFDELIAKHGDQGNRKALRERKGLRGRS